MRAADGLVNEARRLDGEVRRRKGAIREHRRAIQTLRDQQAEIERQCAQLGITVIYETHPDTILAPRSGQTANRSGGPGAGDHPWPQQTRSSTSRP